MQDIVEKRDKLVRLEPTARTLCKNTCKADKQEDGCKTSLGNVTSSCASRLQPERLAEIHAKPTSGESLQDIFGNVTSSYALCLSPSVWQKYMQSYQAEGWFWKRDKLVCHVPQPERLAEIHAKLPSRGMVAKHIWKPDQLVYLVPQPERLAEIHAKLTGKGMIHDMDLRGRTYLVATHIWKLGKLVRLEPTARLFGRKTCKGDKQRDGCKTHLET